MTDLKRLIWDVPDFPKPGILFRDISPLLRSHFAETIDAMDSLFTPAEWRAADAVAGIESRGFLFAAPLALAVLVSVCPEPLGSAMAIAPAAAHAPTDPVITRGMLAGAASRWVRDPWTALAVRTLPNEPGKRHRHYQGSCPAPYFTTDAMHWIVERGVTSLVVDLPSLDRADDGGTLAAHRVFWGLPAGALDARQARRGRALVTELAYVPDHVPDGLYLLDLQVPAFAADAAPSRPVLYPVTEATS